MTQNDADMDETEEEESPKEPQTLQTVTATQLSSSVSNLSASSRAIPSNKDFHFYYNFDEFKIPIQEIAEKSQSLLESIGSSSSNHIFKDRLQFPTDVDIDEAYDWLVNVNDEIFERFDASIDEFRRVREETDRVVGVDSEDGFQLVLGKKNKKSMKKTVSHDSVSRAGGDSGVKVADNKKWILGNKAKVPFHIPTIRRPQEEHNILVNNSNRAFDHVWLERSEDGLRVIHPLERLSVLDFMDKSTGDVEPAPPLPIESTTFKLVEEVKDLKELAAKLRGVNEFAVDLEHNQYRSFQGLTCLMQISTRTEDFIVDTLKLRIHVGPYLREVFKDPAKRKVMHGADRDVVWLQRDFGIYICNLFDTGQASRVLKLERNSLEHLLHHFCGVTANKEYQNADWRLRPLPDEMIRYAREDTHYLLHIYDLMKALLLSKPIDNENADPPLLEVYKRSYDVCMQLYEKELFTENSYLNMYGLPSAGFNAQQLAIVAGLYEWRDAIARAEDESTGYILPNKTLLEIAKEMPVTTSKLRQLLKSKHSYVERHLSSVVSINRHSMQTSAAFEAAVQHLKERHMEIASQEETEANDGSEAQSIPGGNGMNSGVAACHETSAQLEKGLLKQGSSIVELGRGGQGSSAKHRGENVEVNTGSSSYISDTSTTAKVAGATVQVLKKPTGAFGALLGGAVAKRTLDTDKKIEEKIKLEKIRSSVNLPFHSFMGINEPPKLVVEEPIGVSEISHPEESLDVPATGSSLQDIILLDNDSDMEQNTHIAEPDRDDSKTTNVNGDDKSSGSALETDGEEPVSLADLSMSFQHCFPSGNQNKKTSEVKKSGEPSGGLKLKPFDYTTALRSEEDPAGRLKVGSAKNQRGVLDSVGTIKSSPGAKMQKDDETGEYRQGRRRQAFPATGNRSATFR
ncbi:PREDICTED: exosome component 10 [Populus euphratica]|uniref:Exosome component 10 n=1 Tax=Populus euphratica TaxID=75702 RepID=A0AAJ6USU2_POPEU|nr:PREDICTED: exosome component 10 [Populus euphratica]